MAMTHSSSASGARKLGCNERLEFLGDAVLSSVTADFLYSNFRKEREGFLTKSRSNLVCRERLNELAIQIGLDKFVDSCGLQQQHNSYIYGNALEALIGAIYVDKGYAQCRTFLLDRVFSRLNDIEQIVKSDKNYKSRLIEWGQKQHRMLTEDSDYNINTIKNDDNQKEALLQMADTFIGLAPSAYHEWKLRVYEGIHKFIYEDGED